MHFLINVKALGYAAAIAAAVTYGMNPLFAVSLYADGMDAGSVLFFRYLLAAPILGLLMLARRAPFALTRAQAVPLIILGVVMGFSSLALFESYNYMEVSIASTLLFVYPLMVTVIMAAVFHERAGRKTLICLAGAMAGIALLYNGKPDATLSAAGTAWAISGALAYAIYLVAVNRSHLKRMSPLTMSFYTVLSGISVFVLNSLLRSGLAVPSTCAMWLNLLGLALFPTALSLWCTTAAIHAIGSTPTAILGVFEPVTAVFIGLAMFGETLSGRDIAGLVLILAAVCVEIGGANLSGPLFLRRRAKKDGPASRS